MRAPHIESFGWSRERRTRGGRTAFISKSQDEIISPPLVLRLKQLVECSLHRYRKGMFPEMIRVSKSEKAGALGFVCAE